MVVASAFRRSLSLPPAKKSIKACHVRSSSLPCRSLTNLALVKDQMHRIHEWIGRKDPTVQNLLTGLSLLKSLYDTVGDFLHLPQTQDVVHHNERWVNFLLDDLLKFLDVFSVLGTVLSSLKEHHLSTLVSLRRREPNSMEASAQSFINHRKRANKEMSRLTTILKTMVRPQPLAFSREEMDVVTVFNEVKAMTVSISIAVVSGLCWTPRRVIEKLVGLPKRRVDCIKEMNDADYAMDFVLRSKGRVDFEMAKRVSKNMVVLEDCLNGLELGNESIFRSLINTRVCILNILTQ